MGLIIQNIIFGNLEPPPLIPTIQVRYIAIETLPELVRSLSEAVMPQNDLWDDVGGAEKNAVPEDPEAHKQR